MKKLILSSVVLIFLFGSCSKNIDQVAVIEKEKQIKLIRYGSDNTGFYDYNYKGNQVIQEKYSGNNSNMPRVSTFSYDNAGKLKEVNTDYLGKSANIRSEYIYEGDKVIRINNFNSATNELQNYSLREYPAGKFITKSFSKLDVITQKNEYNLTEDGKNYTTMLTYSGTTLNYTTTILKRDDKNSPFKLLPQSFFGFTNTNNSLSVDFIFANPANNQSSRVTYEYNDMGYPIKETNQNGVVTRIFEYVIE